MKKLSCLLIATFPALAAAEEATPISFSGFVDVSVSATTADDSDDVTIGLDRWSSTPSRRPAKTWRSGWTSTSSPARPSPAVTT